MITKIIVTGSRTMKTRKFLLIFIYLYTILFLGGGLQLIGQKWLNYPVYFLLFVLGILAYREEMQKQLSLILPKKKDFLKTISLYMVLDFLLTIASNLLSGVIKQGLGLPLQGQNDARIQVALLENPYLFLLVGCFIGPVVEELFFRRFFLGTFLAKFSNWIGIVLTTFLFAILHMHSWVLSEWVTAISYLGGGLLYTLLYLKKDKNIWYPIALHCCNNIIAFIITLLTINK
ncbi:CAAX amino terminal protease family protein [Streptococcus gordonii]|uniref:CAAX amino terminal protease family protein n=3 Tax=Streptococcus gordonii TaxID=1302 RepID=A8AZT6_STRGC|nr:CAAX amino terminal protease family protein [Streptococcus gordonii str. Challis substr. CH1]VEE23192.1 CAAX amino terminal protease family protein [Streptococcus gordonii]VTS46717.1 CAAX amino terminal protease family protein [Streptococcus gordonii]VTS86613.1 CAAX amino terminal protease family protein [Streptococcus gordonii]VTT11174.1 CAAX amino terminal protease family protein [Streptococcus gordonii]